MLSNGQALHDGGPSGRQSRRKHWRARASLYGHRARSLGAWSGADLVPIAIRCFKPSGRRPQPKWTWRLLRRTPSIAASGECPQKAPSTSAAYRIWQQFGLGANNGCGTRSRAISDVENIQRMPPNLSDDEIHGLMAYARD